MKKVVRNVGINEDRALNEMEARGIILNMDNVIQGFSLILISLFWNPWTFERLI